LLHYFPTKEKEEEEEKEGDDDQTKGDSNNNDADAANEFSDWCGWHNDHGSLTGLLPAMYLDVDGNIIHDPPDVEAGLYIKSRDGRLLKAVIPQNAIAFQVGETAQVHTGGLLKATPHGK
jgi:isopenicillin N synthase-like dioxygenase